MQFKITALLVSVLATSVSAYVNGEGCSAAQNGLYACADAYEALRCDGTAWRQSFNCLNSVCTMVTPSVAKCV
ncbi:hypothetical protein GQ53DRAFT_744687 [Thozetella sp. PMI_491]|nr:hypothetical protein GQ53DRAFT_744687 [Thozetella sp. PMI_491]